MNNSDLKELIKELGASPAEYLPLARRVDAGEFEGLTNVKLAILSSFTIEPFSPYIAVEAAGFGLLCSSWCGPYNQFEQLIHDGQSELYKSDPQVIMLALRIDEVAPELGWKFMATADPEVALQRVIKRLRSLCAGIRSYTDADLLIWNFADPITHVAGLADPLLKVSQQSIISQLNDAVAGICREFSGAYVFDWHRLGAEMGSCNYYDVRFAYYARLPFAKGAFPVVGRRIARYLQAMRLPRRKCLVLDLDNTLWGGVIGEDGMEGIDLGEDYPGNVYKDFQRYILALRDRGVILAIASKNNIAEVDDVFLNHPDCLLKKSDFASVQVGWQDKASSLNAIAEELNISIDSLVFFDDNPAEREWVSARIPKVAVIDVPEHPLAYIQAIEDSGVFDYLIVSDEDRVRTQLYQKERERDVLRDNLNSLDDFLCELDMKATCGIVSEKEKNRVVQLIAKTNQFNVTTRRYSEAQIDTFVRDGALLIWLRLEDRFGSNGLVGTCLCLPETQEKWRIDVLLLSCRVIGRNVELAMINLMARLVLERGGQMLVGEYISTDKNAPAADVYKRAGFESLDERDTMWQWDLTSGVPLMPQYIDLVFQELDNG